MKNYINKSIINDIYFKKYKYLFNYINKQFNLIIQYILYNYITETLNKCNITFIYSNAEQQYNNIIQKKHIKYREYREYEGFNFKNYIINNYKKNILIITSIPSIILNLLSNNKTTNFNVILIYNKGISNNTKTNAYINKIKEHKNYDIHHLIYIFINNFL